jgi:TPP-dependent pyruvate/acetoin dehydrogenase alpha subunit
LTDKDLSDINKSVLEKIDDAVKFAMDSPYPAPEDALADVYSD